jgi:EmrB/QacA subfamily drug resistance transporter
MSQTVAQSQSSPPEAAVQSRQEQAKKWWVLIAVGVSTFMTALDTSVVNIVLPVLNQDLHTSVATIEWIVIIYLLLVSGLLLSFGRLGDLHGHRRIFLTGFVIFVGSSMACGLAASAGWLIAFRGFQAIGAAMLAANSPAILTKSFPNNQRGLALGMQATMTYLGLTVGPTLGGWLTVQYSWRAVFFINVPVGFLALFISFLFVPRDSGHPATEKFDLRGAALFMAGLIALLLGLNRGESWGWTSPAILALLLVAVVLLGIFLVTELRVTNPVLDLSLFHRRIFSAAVASAILNYICVYSILFLMPFYLLQGRLLSPDKAGLLLSAQPLVMAIIAPVSGFFSDKIGSRILGTVGMFILAIGLFLFASLKGTSSALMIILDLAVAGLGIGIFISPNNSALMGAAPRNRQGIAAGILATARSVGMVLGIGLAGAIFTTVLGSQEPVASPQLFQALQAGFIGALIAASLGTVITALRDERSFEMETHTRV